MSIAEYRAAKERLKAFDEWAASATKRGARFTVALEKSVKIEHPRTDGCQGVWSNANDHFDATLRAHLNTATLYKLMAKTRDRLLADCQRLKISAANEARGIIAEDPPK